MTNGKMLYDNKRLGFFRRKIKYLSLLMASRMEMASPTFFVTDEGHAFNIPQEIRYKWFLEYKEAQHKLTIKQMYDRASVSYWMQFLYPLVCMILAALDPGNLAQYLITAVGGSATMKGFRMVTQKGLKGDPQPIVFKNGGEAGKETEISVDLKRPAYMRPEKEGEDESED